MFAGRQARGFKAAKREGRSFSGFADSLPRFRIDDRNSSLTALALEYLEDLKADPFDRPIPRHVPLHLLLSHKALYKAYPELRLLPVALSSAHNASALLVGPILPRSSGRLTDTAIQAKMAPQDGGERLRSILLHEIQHRIQDIEGFTKGSNISWEFRQTISERLHRHGSDSRKLNKLHHRKLLELQQMAMDSGDDLSEILSDRCFTPLVPNAAAAHLFWRLRDYAKARYRQNPGEIEARQVQYELKLADTLPEGHITITSRAYKTRNRQSARFNPAYTSP